LTGQGSTLAGSAARFRAFSTSGVLTGQGAAVTGSAERIGSAVTHDTTGALSGQGSTVAGTSARFRAFATSGVLTGQGSVIDGSAARVGAAVTHDTSGAIVGVGATVNGASSNDSVIPVIPDSPLFGGGGSLKITSRAREELEKMLAPYDEKLELREAREVVLSVEANVKQVEVAVKKIENVARTANALRKSPEPVYERIDWKKIELDQNALRKIESIISQHLIEVDDNEVLLLI
jgi:hypothetical protein